MTIYQPRRDTGCGLALETRSTRFSHLPPTCFLSGRRVEDERGRNGEERGLSVRTLGWLTKLAKGPRKTVCVFVGDWRVWTRHAPNAKRLACSRWDHGNQRESSLSPPPSLSLAHYVYVRMTEEREKVLVRVTLRMHTLLPLIKLLPLHISISDQMTVILWQVYWAFNILSKY